MGRRILFVQFTDPVAYPPLEHSSHLLASRGWDVVFLGVKGIGIENMQFVPHSGIQVKKIPFMGKGVGQKIQYLTFFWWVLYWTIRWKPHWIYASDPLACPIVWFTQKVIGVKTAYHEHDSPMVRRGQSWVMRQIMAFRIKLGRKADICVLPQQKRLDEFVMCTQRTKITFCVWNCPRLEEIPEETNREQNGLIVYYHGSITRARLPPQLIIAASRFHGDVRIVVAGYETLDSSGYLRELNDLAAKNNVPKLIESFGTMPRSRLWRVAARAQVGISLVPNSAEDINLKDMVGASNKTFDYMASGLALLVSRLPDWQTMFVKPGYARACNPDDSDSIECALRWYLDNPVERKQMGLTGKRMIYQAWNYDNMFAPVIEILERE
jgi:glycosyltransferase involved in cell wall biosynthesis